MPSTAAAQPLRPVAESKPPIVQRFYRPELDVLRFVAFFCIFVTHSQRPYLNVQMASSGMSLNKIIYLIQDACTFGMSIFFFLSSYLITELLQKEISRTGTIHLGSFYLRRILRIWPLYFAFIAFCYVLGRLNPAYHVGGGLILSFLLLAGNWYVSRHGFPINPINPLWSISVEEQFYVFWPSIAKYFGCSGLWTVSLILIPVSLLTGYYCVTHGLWHWNNTLVQFFYFSLGAITALVLQGRVLQISIGNRIYMLLAGAALFVLAEASAPVHHLVTPPIQPVVSPSSICVGYVLSGLGTVLVFCGLLGMPERFLPAWLRYLGRISYGLYVFHLGCRFAVASIPLPASLRYIGYPALTFAMVVPLAILSYEYFEKPFLKLKERFTFVPSRAA